MQKPIQTCFYSNLKTSLMRLTRSWMLTFIDFSVKLTLMIAAELEQKLKMSDTNSKDFQKQLSDLRKALNNAKVRSWVL